MAGLYIHIPFCESRCIYCGFYSTTLLSLRNQYVDAIIEEMKLKAIHEPWKAYRDQIETIYIGGGTPSVLSPSNLDKLFDSIFNIYNVKEGAEVTIECNPDDITTELAHKLCTMGVNRVSMGVQTFDDARLRWLRRRHTAKQAEEVMRLLRNAGINNISLDLIYGFPEQTVEEWEEDVKRLLSLAPEHVSAYSLMYEEGTSIYKMLEEGRIKEIEDTTSLMMYEKLATLMRNAGYEHYEISNFAKHGYRAIHNTSYWEDKPYIGIGAGAHGYNKNKVLTRHANICDISKYISNINKGEICEEVEYIDEVSHYNDLITTQLRTSAGIDTRKLSKFFHDYIMKEASAHIASGKLKLEDGRLHLTQNGIFVSDSIMSDLIYIP